MSLTSNDITAKNFKKFYEALSPYLGSYDKGKLTFVGEVKAFFAETAPNGFLVCDGATYNKADYPQLANLLLSLTDHSAYEVSGDDTKFKVPDLRGEFLRGSGSNSHTNQGSGAGVGEHQDGTEHLSCYNDGVNMITPTENLLTNTDTKNTSVGNRRWIKHTGSDNNANTYTSRPTNTSVLYCIAYKDTMVDLDFLSYGGERFAKSDMYDTNERVIGKWIDGKPLYQKTLVTTSPAASSNGSVVEKKIPHGIANIDKIVSSKGDLINETSATLGMPAFTNSGYKIKFSTNATQITIANDSATWNNSTVFITLIYTKTTDTANSFKYSTPTDYSTEEKIVGTWIDGKPVYQKTIIKQDSAQLISFPNVDVIDIRGTGFDTSDNSIQAVNWVHPMYSTKYGYMVSYSDNALQFRVGSSITMSNIKWRVIIQYTKTTDA